MRKRIAVLLVLAAVLAIALAGVTHANGWRWGAYKGLQVVKVYVNGSEVALDVPAVVVDGRTLVPIRFVGQILGATVDWDEVQQKVFIYSEKNMAASSISDEQILGGIKITNTEGYSHHEEFRETVIEALKILRDKCPEYYDFTLRHIRVVNQGADAETEMPTASPSRPLNFAFSYNGGIGIGATIGSWSAYIADPPYFRKTPSWVSMILVHEAGHIWLEKGGKYRLGFDTYQEEENWCSNLGDTALSIISNQLEKVPEDKRIYPPLD